MGSKTLTMLLGITVIGAACAGGGTAVGNSANKVGTDNSASQAQAQASPAMQAQDGEKKPPLSPAATAETTVAGKKITINYSAPSMRGRKIMGDLVPYDKVWRTGANTATSFITEADLKIGDLNVSRGTYSIYTLPGEKGWKLIINKQTGQSGTVYNQDQDLGRTDMQVKQIQPAVELFKISLTPAGDSGGVLTLTWENTEASVPFTVVK